MARVIHFEFNAVDPERAQNFYSKVLGWKFSKWDGPFPYWMVDTGQGPGINGGMMTNGKVAVVVQVDNLDETIRAVEANGGTIAMPRATVEGVGHIAYFNDPEGNMFGLIEPLGS